MLIQIMKSKLHKARITYAHLDYEGSVTIDEELMEKAGLLPGEKVQVVNKNNGERLETYVIVGERGKRQVGLNGPAARKGMVGDEVVIISYALMTPEEARTNKPKIIILGENNDVTQTL